MLRNEDFRWDTAAKLEDLKDGAGWTFIGLTEKYDSGYIPGGLSIVELAELYKHDQKAAINIIIAVYDTKYWPGVYDKIKFEKLAIRLFDAGINCGVRTSIKLLQCTLADLGAEIVIDGGFGPQTLDAVNRHSGPVVLKEYKKVLENHYHAIIAKDPSKARFHDGWQNRLNRDEFAV